MKNFFTFISRPKKTQAQANRASEAYLRHVAALSSQDVLKEVAADCFGLSQENAQQRLAEFGPNVIRSEKSHGPLFRFMEALINPFNFVLFLVATITFVTDVLLSRRPDYLTAGVIFALILISSLISFIQGEKSHSAAAQLSALAATDSGRLLPCFTAGKTVLRKEIRHLDLKIKDSL